MRRQAADVNRKALIRATLHPDDAKLWSVMQASLHLPALVAATRIGLFEALARRSLPIPSLAARVGITERAAMAFAGLFASMGFLSLSGGSASLTVTARAYLIAGGDAYWGPMLDRLASLPLRPESLVEASRGEHVAVYGGPEMWKMHAREPDRARTFAEGAHARAQASARALARQAVFRRVRRLLDVAGGKGTYSVAFASANSHLHATLLELPAAAALAREYVRQSGCSTRVRVRAMDMFRDPWPRPVDAVWFSDVFHDWSPRQCRQLAASAFRTLAPGGRVLVNEVLLDARRSGPLAATSYGLAMLFSTREGRQYTLTDLAAILNAAGFADVRVIARAGAYSLLSGLKSKA